MVPVPLDPPAARPVPASEDSRTVHGQAMHLNWRVLTVLLAALTTLSAPPALAQETTGAVLKGAFVFNFARFTEWPQDVLPSDAPLVACVVGDEEVAEALTSNAENRPIAGHSVVVATRTENTLQDCHLVYVSTASASTMSETVASVDASPVLTISDVDDFALTGGIAQLYVQGGKMRFRVNLASVTRARLRLSSRLLSLAELVND